MVELHHIYVVLYAGTAVLALVATLVAWTHRAARGAVSIAVLMLGVAIWSGASSAMWYVPTLGQQVFWLTTEELGIWMVPVAFLTVAFGIAGMERWRTPGRIALISIASFAFANIEWLNPGRLFDRAFVAETMGSYTHYESVPGPLYWASAAFAYALIIVAFVIIFRVYLRSSGAARTQAAILLIGGLIPFVASAVTESRMVPLGYLDLAPLAFQVTGTLWLTAILRGTLLDVLPLARDVLVEQTSDGVVVLDGEDLVVDANPAALTMLHTPLAEMLGKSAEALLRGVKGATAFLSASGPRHAVLPIGSDGDSRYVEVGITPLVVGPGRPPAHLVTLHDVTEKRRADERLKLARQVFDTASEGIVVALPDADEQIIDVNDAYCRLTGRLREDVVGKGISYVQSARHAPEFYKAMEETLFTAGEWKGEVWQERADGTVFPSWLSLSVAKDDQEQVTHIVGIFTDITPIRKTEELRVAKEAAEAATVTKSAFLANMSHELRTPLNSIIGFSGVLAQGLAGPLTDEQRTQLGMVNVSGRRLLALINDILDLAKIEAGKTEIHVESIDAAALLREVADVLRPLATARGLDLRVDTDGGEGTLRSDASKVRQILTNLVGNAIKFADHGVIGLTVRIDPSGAASFSVQDTGRGIAAEDLQRIFEEFTQIEDHETAKPSGTGLGLRICQGYADLLGGDLRVASELGVGSTFTLRLPPGPPVAHSASDREPG